MSEVLDRAISTSLEAKYQISQSVKGARERLPKRVNNVINEVGGKIGQGVEIARAPYERFLDWGYGKRWGIRREFREPGLIWAPAFLEYSKKDEAKHETIILGEFPKEGAAICAANHTDRRDVVKAVSAIRRSGRIIRCIARDTLLDVRLTEDTRILEETGKEENDLLKEPLAKRWIASFMMRGLGTIPLRRGSEIPISTLKTARSFIKRGFLVGCFLQQTRIEDGSLGDLYPGVGYLARSEPNTPVVPIGISGNENGPDMFNIGEGFTFNEAKSDPSFDIEGLNDDQRMTVFVAGRVAMLLPKLLEERWANQQREEAITKFRSLNEEEKQKRATRRQKTPATKQNNQTPSIIA